MRYSANLNIMIKAIEKASFKTSRDFYELEILQNNQTSAIKFANSCYNRIKRLLIDDLSNIKPDYNLFFADGEKIINNETAQYSFAIYPIDGLNNLSRSLADCSIAIALQYKNEENIEQTIGVAIYKIVGGDLYYAEKGFGAFLNNRKIKSSKRNNNDAIILSCDNFDILEKAKNNISSKNIAYRNFGCKTLEISYLASGKIDLLILDKSKSEFIKKFSLIAEESGSKLQEKDDILLLNG